MRTHIIWFMWLLCIGSPIMAVADMWKGNKPPPPLKKDETSVALRLEKDKDSVDYFLANIHKKISELDAKKGEGNFGYKYVTYGLVAKIYYWYGDPLKSAEYFYKDWVDCDGRESLDQF